MRPVLACWAVAALSLLTAVPCGAQVPLGGEFRINEFTTGTQQLAQVGADASGRFVVAWAGNDQDGSGSGIFARLFDAAGAPLGSSEFRVNVQTANSQYDPALAMQGSGAFVVVWASVNQDGSDTGIFARQFDAAGVAGPEFRVNTYTTFRQAFPAVAYDAAGNFIVVWASERDGSVLGIYAQRYNAAGVPQGGEFRVNTYTPDQQMFPKVAMAPAGNFVVVWDSYRQDGDIRGVFGQRFNAAGAPAGAEFRVNSYTTSQQSRPDVATDANGNFVVVWQSYQQQGSNYEVFAKRYDSAGVAQGSEFRVSAYVGGRNTRPAVAYDEAGNFVVVWSEGLGQDGDAYGAFGRMYSAQGLPGAVFAVNTYTTNLQGIATVAFDGDGRFHVAWHDFIQDGSGTGIIGRRFAGDHIFKDGFETSTLAAWSGSATDGGDLSTSIFAAMKSTGVGLQGVVDDVAGLYVEDQSPHDESRYRARFYLDPNGFDPGEAQGHRRTRTLLLFSEAPTRRVAAVVLRRLSGAFSLMARARLDDNTQADTPFFAVSDGPHVVEIELFRAVAPDTQDGQLQLWIDSVPVATLSSLDNNLAEVDFVRLGALSVKSGAGGTIYWDEFESRRQSFIGP